MKNLLFLTSHRQVEEINFYGRFLKNCYNVKNFDLFLLVNNTKIDLNKVNDAFESLPNKNKKLVITNKTCGYQFGLHEAISNYFDFFSEYDNVIHSHPDVFIVDDFPLNEILHSNLEIPIITNMMFGINESTKSVPSTDLFVFRPKKLKINIFKEWEFFKNSIKDGFTCPMLENHFVDIDNFLFQYQLISEQFLEYQIKKYKIPFLNIKRYDNDNWKPTRICAWGCWHQHDLFEVESYLNARNM
jgi:hypothetical protein